MHCESVILAAGQGTRMRSSLPKAFHRLAGRELLSWAEAAARAATGRPPVVVVGPEMESARQLLPGDVRFVIQTERRGTGHALLQAAQALQGTSDAVLVTTSDMPLLSPETLKRVMAAQASHDGPLALLSVTAADPRGFGRVVRDEAGRVRAVVEETEAQPDELAIRELNTSVYCFRSDWLWDRLPSLPLSGRGEYLLTDLVAAAASEGGAVAVPAADDEETLGINTRAHLSEAEAILRRRINRAWMLAGVTIADPATTYIAPDVQLGADTLLLPNTHLEGRSSIGSGCVVGPNSIVRNSAVGDRCRIEASVLEGCELAEDVHVGPFAHLRPGARLGRGVHMGNFGEVKNSTLEAGVKMGHFSYVGDATVGAETNIGAGTITCNFGRDGKKNRTEIGEGAFIGSDSLLVAPVRIGRGATTGAGSVVTRDVPDGALAVGMPARLVRPKEDRA